MSFSATDAAFEGFRLVRRNPLAILVWSLIYAVMTIGQLFATGDMMRSMLSMTEMMEGMEASPPTTLDGWMPLLQAYGEMMSHMAWLFPVSLMIGAILSTAVARGVLRPETRAFGHVRLGMDEVRVFIVTIVIAILAGLISMIVFFAAFAIGGIAIAQFEGWGGLVLALAILAAIAFIIWLTVRWSLAVPITVAEKRIDIFASFALTKGRFWPLLGMALIAGVMALLVAILCSVISGPISMMMGMSMWGGAGTEDPEAIAAMFDIRNPWVIASGLVNAVSSALMIGVISAPFSAAYRGIKGG